ncbi:UNVERIFIED_CONTAM: hypothetical protein FKN15_021661 [Acipenser sinensis]
MRSSIKANNKTQRALLTLSVGLALPFIFISNTDESLKLAELYLLNVTFRKGQQLQEHCKTYRAGFLCTVDGLFVSTGSQSNDLTLTRLQESFSNPVLKDQIPLEGGVLGTDLILLTSSRVQHSL